MLFYPNSPLVREICAGSSFYLVTVADFVLLLVPMRARALGCSIHLRDGTHIVTHPQITPREAIRIIRDRCIPDIMLPVRAP